MLNKIDTELPAYYVDLSSIILHFLGPTEQH